MDPEESKESTVIVPEKTKYTVCFLDSHGNPQQYIVFGGRSKPMSEDEIKIHLFSDEKQRADINAMDPPPIFHHSLQQIHTDDSVRTIKKKIIHEYGVNNISYEELYLFVNRKENISLLTAYQQMKGDRVAPATRAKTRLERQLQELENISGDLDKRTLGQFLFNLKVDSIAEIREEVNDTISYEELLKFLPKEDEYEISAPLGQKFSKTFEWLFPGNPFDVLSGDGEPVFRRNKKNELYVFENHLLMNYGKLEENVIYVCLAKDVLEYANEHTIDPEYLIDLYFPLLRKKEITDLPTLLEKQQTLIEQTKKLMTSATLQSFDTIDIFYDIYYNRQTNLPYLNRGIEAFDIVLHPDFDVPLPLDIIFKQIHAIKQIPYIKYNPGLRRENMFRFYSEEIAKNGKKIPFLKKSQIYSANKVTGKLRQISLLIHYDVYELYLDFEYNGNLRIRSSNIAKAISVNDVETIIYNVVNPILININQFLERSGYTFRLFDRLSDPHVEIIQLEYNCKINLKRPLKLTGYLGCLTQLFDIVDTQLDLSKQINMQFVRVDNYKKMTAIASLITEVFRKTNSQEEIISALMINFTMDRDTALKEVVNYFNDHIRIQGQYVNKNMDIADNPGFPLTMNKSPFDDKLIVKVTKINSVDFIEVLHVYIDTILRVTQFPDTIEGDFISRMTGFCSKSSKQSASVAQEVPVENVLAVSPIVIEPLVFAEEEEEGEEEEDEDGDDKYLPSDDDEANEVDEADEEADVEGGEEGDQDENAVEEDEEDDDRFLPSPSPEHQKGGARKKLDRPPVEAKQEKSNIFTKRIKEREPTLILTKKQGKFSSYSRICPANVSLQPVILTDEEKKRIDEEHPGSYTNAIQYGTDPQNPYWYICPRYWCLKNNTPMTEEEVARGECGGKIIPNNAKAPPPGHYIYEFTDDKYHKNEKGEYIYHSPGFKPEHSHPDGLCLPCCYNKWSSYNMKNPIEQQRRRQQCGLTDNYVVDVDPNTGENVQKMGPDGKPMQTATPAPKTESKKEPRVVDAERQRRKVNIFGVERVPVPQYRWGFLPLSVELFLHTDNSKYVVKNNPALIQPHKRPLLRYGVEVSQHQSFVAVVADIYSYYHNVPLPSIAEMRDILTRLVTLDIYLQLHNGSLVSIFKPSRRLVDDLTVEKYSETAFYQSIRLDIPAQYRFLQDTVSSYENFIAYLNDPDSMIDHTYLWDLIASPTSPLFDGGINMVILRIYDNDVTDDVELLCPTSAYSNNIYVKDRGTILLLLHNDFYEPIYLYEDKDKEYPLPPVKIFTKTTGSFELRQLQRIFSTVIDTMDQKCKPIHKRPRVYEYRENISATDLGRIATEQGFSVTAQVMDYRGKIIGISITVDEDISNKPLFLPCFPSSESKDIPKIYIDGVEWVDYVTTRDQFIRINRRTNGAIRCKPLLKVVEDGLIVGILTETNQFVFVDPPAENLIEDGIPATNAAGYKNYLAAESELTTGRGTDNERVNTVRNIALETQFYTSFRSIVRNLANDYLNREIRQEIIDVLENPQYLYTVKVKKTNNLLRRLTKDAVIFVDEMDANVQRKLANAIECTTNCDVRSYCLMKKDKMCIPRKHLISGTDNETNYFMRAADELVRYKRIQLFMLEPRRYLNITNVEFMINDDEVLVLASVLNDAYFDSLESYNKNKYVKNIVYEVGEPTVPSIGQRSWPIQVEPFG